MTTMRANPKTVTTIFAVIRTSPQILALFNRSEFAKTDTELKAMASEASIGLSSMPKNG